MCYALNQFKQYFISTKTFVRKNIINTNSWKHGQENKLLKIYIVSSPITAVGMTIKYYFHCCWDDN